MLCKAAYLLSTAPVPTPFDDPDAFHHLLTGTLVSAVGWGTAAAVFALIASWFPKQSHK